MKLCERCGYPVHDSGPVVLCLHCLDAIGRMSSEELDADLRARQLLRVRRFT